MGSVFGKNIIISLFGESHGEAVGIVIDGFPQGLKIDFENTENEMERRRAKKNGLTTNRIEEDKAEIISGLLNNTTTGSPICVLIKNTNTRSGDYENLKNHPRPSHADYAASIRYNGFNDLRGGGHFSARLTAPLVFLGSICKQLLKERFNIFVEGHIKEIAGVFDNTEITDDISMFRENHKKPLSVFSNTAMEAMIKKIENAKMEGDSVGGKAGLFVFNMPAGIGEPFFSSLESRISQAIFAVPAVKAVEFGLGVDFSKKKGSECNDSFIFNSNENKIKTKTNNNGGINGGITNGASLEITVTIKPTPSISKEQKTLNTETLKEESLIIKGRHDPCVVPRGLVVLESVLAFTILDILIEYKGRC